MSFSVSCRWLIAIGVLTFATNNIAAAFPTIDKPDSVSVSINGHVAVLRPVISTKTSKTDNYEYETFTPYLSGYESAAVTAFNAEAAAMVAKEVKEFVAYSGPPSELENSGDQQHTVPNDLTISYEVCLTGPTILSVVFYEAYFYGGPHHDWKSLSINFNLRTATTIQLVSLFKDPTRCRGQLSIFCEKTLDGEQYAYQSSPFVEKDTTWVLTSSGIRVIFDPYTVGCFADGFIEVTVPFEKLRGFRRPKGMRNE